MRAKSEADAVKRLGAGARVSALVRVKGGQGTSGAQSPPAPSSGADATVGRLVAIGSDGAPWVRCEGPKHERPQRARSTVHLSPAAVGREVLVCRAAPRGTLVIVGVLVEPGATAVDPARAVDLTIDRERVVLAAKQEVILRCGEACVKLSANGKVVVEGADVISSAKRVNRLRGGAVKIN